MMDAVDSIGKEMFNLGTRMENPRLKAFSLMTLGEIAAKEHIEDPLKADAGIH